MKHRIGFLSLFFMLQFLCSAMPLSPSYSGWNNLLELTINGNPIDSEDSEGKPRLLAHGNEVLTKDKKTANWWRNNRPQALLIMFARQTWRLDC